MEILEREREKKMRKERSELLALAALFVLSPAGISPCLTAAVTGRYASESALDPLACCNSQQLCPRLLFGLGVLFASFFDWLMQGQARSCLLDHHEAKEIELISKLSQDFRDS